MLHEEDVLGGVASHEHDGPGVRSGRLQGGPEHSGQELVQVSDGGESLDGVLQRPVGPPQFGGALFGDLRPLARQGGFLPLLR